MHHLWRFIRISVSERIVREFQGSDVKYAKVSFDKLKGDYKPPIFCARGIGRVLKRLKLDEKITVYSGKDNVHLERLK